MFIYCATSPSGKHYVGQTTRDIHVRWREHVHDAHDAQKDRCKVLNRAIRKHGGDTFDVRIVAYCLPWFLDDLEAEMMNVLGSISPHGYNIKLGGSSGRHNEETKAKIRDKLVGKKFRAETLEKRGRSRKTLKDLPMFMIGWYRGGNLVGIRVCNHPTVKEKHFALSRFPDFDACKRAAQEYMDGPRSST